MNLKEFRPLHSGMTMYTIRVGEAPNMTGMDLGVVLTIEALPVGVLVTGDKGSYLFTPAGEGAPAGKQKPVRKAS